MKTTPQITHKKWWHKLIPSYRKQIKIMNDFYDYYWEHGGREEHEREMKEVLLKALPPYTNKGKVISSKILKPGNVIQIDKEDIEEIKQISKYKFINKLKL